MATLIEDCPRCHSKRMTFDILGRNAIKQRFGHANWQQNFEVFSKCRHCLQGTIFVVCLNNYGVSNSIGNSDYWGNKNINSDFEVSTFISVKDFAAITPPEFLPPEVENAFTEGAACLSIRAFNAAAAMFRLSVDLATKGYLPPGDRDGGPNRKQRRELASRLEWLFDEGILAGDLKDLASSVREDGNDGVHDGTLGREDAEDLADFATALLTRIYTEPARVELARQRRISRRETKT